VACLLRSIDLTAAVAPPAVRGADLGGVVLVVRAEAERVAHQRREHLGEAGPLSRGVQAGRKALRIRHINGMEVRKKRPRGFKKRPRGFK
jgi:hypothetical protein